jgi:CheY-like chemotaxis protein
MRLSTCGALPAEGEDPARGGERGGGNLGQATWDLEGTFGPWFWVQLVRSGCCRCGGRAAQLVDGSGMDVVADEVQAALDTVAATQARVAPLQQPRVLTGLRRAAASPNAGSWRRELMPFSPAAGTACAVNLKSATGEHDTPRTFGGVTWLRLEVEDDGAGVPADRVASLFLPFHQLAHRHGSAAGLDRRIGGATATSAAAGAGMGLYLCHEIATRHGGRVGHTRKPDGCTLFWCEVPVRSIGPSACREPDARLSAAVPPSAHDSALAVGRSVVDVVDDDLGTSPEDTHTRVAAASDVDVVEVAATAPSFPPPLHMEAGAGLLHGDSNPVAEVPPHLPLLPVTAALRFPPIRLHRHLGGSVIGLARHRGVDGDSVRRPAGLTAVEGRVGTVRDGLFLPAVPGAHSRPQGAAQERTIDGGAGGGDADGTALNGALEDVLAGVAVARTTRNATIPSTAGVSLAGTLEALNTPPAPPMEGAGAQPSLSPAQQPCILVVDDVDSIRALLARRLSRMLPMARLLEAVNGRDALEAMAREAAEGRGEVDAVCIDGTMPVMTGYEAVRLMRDRGYGGLVVGITGNALREDVDRFVRCGCDVVLPKPVDIAALRRLLQDRLPEHAWGGGSGGGDASSEDEE